MLADVFGRPVQVCAERELTSRGAAAVGLEALGLLDVGSMDPPRARTLRPDRRRHAVYREAAARQAELRRKIT
jgi:sugar (pentulose or hexulose) kinase